MSSRSGDLPLGPGDTGEAVGDVQRRLTALGFVVARDQPGTYGPGTEAAVRRFQGRRGLRVDGVCGRQTWSSLVEAGYRLGDRFLYLRSPMLRGDDINDLQHLLGALGFDAGRVDGMLGERTASALAEFQRNAGLTTDGICGPGTVAELTRLGSRADRGANVAITREAEALRAGPRHLAGRRIAIGETGGLAALADKLGGVLIEAGAVVVVLHHPDESVQAVEANEFNASVYLGLAVLDEPGRRTAYYATDDFHAVGAKRLADLLIEELPAPPLGVPSSTVGMRLPILRETRMAAVLCELGPVAVVVRHAPAVVAGLGRALTRWVTVPIEA